MGNTLIADGVERDYNTKCRLRRKRPNKGSSMQTGNKQFLIGTEKIRKNCFLYLFIFFCSLSFLYEMKCKCENRLDRQGIGGNVCDCC